MYSTAFKANLGRDYILQCLKIRSTKPALKTALLLCFPVNTQPQQAEKEAITLQKAFYLATTSQKPSI